MFSPYAKPTSVPASSPPPGRDIASAASATVTGVSSRPTIFVNAARPDWNSLNQSPSRAIGSNRLDR